MRLNGQQVGTLTQILVNAFSRDELTILVRVKLDLVLAAEISTDEAWRKVAFDLIDNLERQERTIELIRAIREERPKNTTLVAFCDPMLAGSNGVAQPGSTDELRKAVAVFDGGFQRRNVLFKYLNAYKALHDVLHELQSFLPKISAAVAERIADPSQPLADDVALFFEDNVKIVRESVPETEFPENPPSWIARFVTAAEVIGGSDVEKLPRHFERLKTLPPEGLGPLNDKMFENASRLDPRQLVAALNSILAAIGTGGNPAMATLRAEVEEFRSLCTELGELKEAHNLCQKIDDALHEAAGLRSVTSKELSDWDIAKESLDELVLQRSRDRRVQRTIEAAKLFEAANQGQEFLTFIERFDDLFMQTDKSLLKLTNKLPRKANDLHAALEQFQ